MNLGTLRELRADNAKTHALLTELIGYQKRTAELLAILLLTEPPKPAKQDKPALAGTLETEPPPMPKPPAPKTAARKGK